MLKLMHRRGEWVNCFGVSGDASAIRDSVRFLDRLDNITDMISVTSASTVIYGIRGDNGKQIALLGSAVVTVFAMLNLVVASAHSDFVRQQVELEKLTVLPASLESLIWIKANRPTIELSESPPLHV